MDFRLSDEQELLRASVREFAEAEIRPHVMEWDEAQHFPMDLLPKLAELGLMGIQFPEQYGGSAMSAVDYCICIEELARVCPAIALSVAAHNGLCTSHIAMFGNDAQKAEFLPRLVSGEVLGAWGLTEAGAGSDAAGMRTDRRAATGSAGCSNGSKNFITHGAHRRRDGRHGGDRPGERQSRHLGLRRRTRHAGNERGQEGEQARHARERHQRGGLRGLPRPGGATARRRRQGFINTLQVLDAGRIGIAALAVGLAQGAYEAARDYAKQRRQFGQPIAAFQAIQWMLADIATRIEAARLLTLSRRLPQGSRRSA